MVRADGRPRRHCCQKRFSSHKFPQLDHGRISTQNLKASPFFNRRGSLGFTGRNISAGSYSRRFRLTRSQFQPRRHYCQKHGPTPALLPKARRRLQVHTRGLPLSVNWAFASSRGHRSASSPPRPVGAAVSGCRPPISRAYTL